MGEASTSQWLLLASVLVLALVGAGALTSDLDGVWPLVVWAMLVVGALLRFVPKPHVKAVGFVVGATVVPLFALLGVDWVWATLTDGAHPGPIPSWLIGAVIFALAGAAYTAPLAGARRVSLAVVPALVLIILLPVGIWGYREVRGDAKALKQAPEAVSTLHVVLLRGDGDSSDPQDQYRQGWNVRTFVARVDGPRVEWGAGGAPPNGRLENTDRVVMLMPGRDAGAGKAVVSRWLRLADAVAPPRTPTHALLPTGAQAALPAWERATAAVHGSARIFAPDGGARLDDLALQLATRAASADADLALAIKHRPALFFDSGEKYRVPLNVDRLLESERIRICEEDQTIEGLCGKVRTSADLHNGGTHLAFDPDELATVDQDPTIYVNVTRSGNDHPNAIYLDYWWYLPNNEARAAGGALCGSGFVIPGLTCQDHQSDWEGVTVVLDEDAPPTAPPTAVSYAQHDDVVRYSWSALQRLWDDGARDRFGHQIDISKRPLVFVANGRHASYPTSCTKKHCSVGRVPGIDATRPLKDLSHDGGRPWSQNTACAALCVSALPTRDGGRHLARWNAFAGGWGSAKCALSFLCTRAKPPEGPGFQDRFAKPWCWDERFDFAREKFTPGGRRCEKRDPPAGQVERGQRLLALGDSFSSGEGGGDYEPGSDDSDNSCHRSPHGWPQVLAERRGLVALPSLACSGATTLNLLAGDPADDEPERQESQVGRIRRNPHVVTLSIGGNDAGFVEVLKKCLRRNCARSYGDALTPRLDELARKLPEVYRRVRDAAPGARLVVMGYPRLFPKGDFAAASNCAAWRFITPADVKFLNGLVVQLNERIEHAARAAGATFADVQEAFDGQELRCEGPTYMNRLRLLPLSRFKASFHPNVRGYARLAAVVDEQMGDR